MSDTLKELGRNLGRDKLSLENIKRRGGLLPGGERTRGILTPDTAFSATFNTGQKARRISLKLAFTPPIKIKPNLPHVMLIPKDIQEIGDYADDLFITADGIGFHYDSSFDAIDWLGAYYDSDGFWDGDINGTGVGGIVIPDGFGGMYHFTYFLTASIDAASLRDAHYLPAQWLVGTDIIHGVANQFNGNGFSIPGIGWTTSQSIAISDTADDPRYDPGLPESISMNLSISGIVSLSDGKAITALVSATPYCSIGTSSSRTTSLSLIRIADF